MAIIERVFPVTTSRRSAIAQLCDRHAVRHLALFGSVLREDFDSASSDIDVAVEFAATVRETPANQYFGLKADLESLFGLPVDLVELNAMPESRLKRIIRRTLVPVYGDAEAV